jgi:putative spermidine/putrescine transport system substrate-binding protein
MKRRDFFGAAVAAGAAVGAGWRPAQAQQARAICYNCPPEWADWGGMLRLFQQRLSIQVPPDNKNSGQSLAALIAERNAPVADFTYLGGQVGPQAKEAGVLAPYKPPGFERIADGLKDPDGHWFTIHSGTLGLFMNTAALRNTPPPTSWRDLLNARYRGMVGYLDPTSAAVGQVGVVAVNLALGGSYQNFDPAMNFFKELKANNPIVPRQTSYARVLSGEIPILFDYDFNAYRAQYTDRAPCRFVIPQEGTQILPYVVGLVRNGPNPDQGKRVLDFLLTQDGQRHWANAFLRPVFPEAMSAEARTRFLPDADYARARPLDVSALAGAVRVIVDRYQREVG